MTPEQVLALAPDASSAKAGRELAVVRKWIAPGRFDQGQLSPGQRDQLVLWGEHQGSGSKPYRTVIDLSGPAFSCTCPSRKFPCKHGLGLLLLHAEQGGVFVAGDPPEWAQQWLVGRSQRAEQKAEKAAAKSASTENGSNNSGESTAEAEAAAQRRAAQRESRVAKGLEQTRVWLQDLIESGLAQAQTQPDQWWQEQSKRLVDAQAPGAALLVRELASAVASGEGWQLRSIEALTRLHLMLTAATHLSALPEPSQADVRAAIGFTQAQDSLRTQSGVVDRWLICGQSLVEEDQLLVQRSWLWGQRAQQMALVLQFSHPSQPMNSILVPGTCFEGELCYFPSQWPLRALVKSREVGETDGTPPPSESIEVAIAGYGAALAAQPWLRQYPMRLQAVVPQLIEAHWWLRETAGAALPVSPRYAQPWLLAALSGGAPLQIFGEWDGRYLMPLQVWADGRRWSV